MGRPDLPRALDLPEWMVSLRDRYLYTDTGQFILHGNVHDVVLCGGQVWSMPAFLDAFFDPSGKLVVHYDPGRGIWFPDDAHAVRAARSLVRHNFVAEEKVAPRGVTQTSKKTVARNLREELGNERTPEIALEALEVLLSDPEEPTAVIIHYAELVAPDGSISTMSFLDRTASARLHRWSLSNEIVRGDNLVLMLTGALSDLSRRLTRNPRVGALHVPLPPQAARQGFLGHLAPDLPDDRSQTLGRVTAGLQLRQIQDLVAPRLAAGPDSAAGSDLLNPDVALPLEEISARKKQILEQECHGLIEVVSPDHGFDVVGGMEPIKNALNRVAGHVKAGRRTQVPMGILFVGPMGTGKTFLAEAFARESGLAAVKLKNFRDKWVGSTEANLEKVLNVVEALGEILVMIDEGDRSIGGAGDSDGGVNSRVIARLKEFMSDTSHRGRIIFVMMTNRPDKLDTDIKRPGRFDLKIPFFPPQDATTRAAILRALVRRHKIDADFPDEELLPLLEGLEGYAAADLEALVLLANDDFKSEILPPGIETMPQKVSMAFLRQATADFMPTRETTMIEYMELLAVSEASNRRLLPERYKEIQVGDLNARLGEVRQALMRAKAHV